MSAGFGPVAPNSGELLAQKPGKKHLGVVSDQGFGDILALCSLYRGHSIKVFTFLESFDALLNVPWTGPGEQAGHYYLFSLA